MEKERKTIKCSYAVLVIILFAALAFVTDYAIIERKMNKCDCPKCEIITNNEENNEPIINNGNSNEQDTNNNEINNNTENVQVNENDISIRYLQNIVFYEDGIHWKSREIVLNPDGTAKWGFAGLDAGGNLYDGYYKEMADKIILTMFSPSYYSLKCDENSLFDCTVAIMIYKNSDGSYKSIEYGNEYIYKNVNFEDLKLFKN